MTSSPDDQVEIRNVSVGSLDMTIPLLLSSSPALTINPTNSQLLLNLCQIRPSYKSDSAFFTKVFEDGDDFWSCKLFLS